MYFNHIEKNNKKKIIIINYHYLLYLFAIINYFIFKRELKGL